MYKYSSSTLIAKYCILTLICHQNITEIDTAYIQEIA